MHEPGHRLGGSTEKVLQRNLLNVKHQGQSTLLDFILVKSFVTYFIPRDPLDKTFEVAPASLMNLINQETKWN